MPKYGVLPLTESLDITTENVATITADTKRIHVAEMLTEGVVPEYYVAQRHLAYSGGFVAIGTIRDPRRHQWVTEWARSKASAEAVAREMLNTWHSDVYLLDCKSRHVLLFKPYVARVEQH